MFWNKRCVCCERKFDIRVATMWEWLPGQYVCDYCFHGIKPKPRLAKVSQPRKYGRCFLMLRHKVIEIKGQGFRCKYCNKPQGQCLGVNK
jgi:hypothetical protein